MEVVKGKISEEVWTDGRGRKKARCGFLCPGSQFSAGGDVDVLDSRGFLTCCPSGLCLWQQRMKA